MDCSPPGASVHGILQARTLEWVAISSARGNLPDPGIKPRSPALQAEPPGQLIAASDKISFLWPKFRVCVCVCPNKYSSVSVCVCVGFTSGSVLCVCGQLNIPVCLCVCVCVCVGFTSGSVLKNLSANAGDPVSIPGWESSPGGGHGNPLQHPCLESPKDRGAWRGYSPWGHKEYQHVCVYIFSVFIRPLITHLGCFHVLAIVNSAEVNSGANKSPTS